MSGAEIHNVGYTMATTREGIYLLRDFICDSELVFIQFGLVDSYKTFKYSPYVHYYPDSFKRKQLRSLAKKYKKTCRKMGLNKIWGEINVVAIEEYRSNIESMIEFAAPRIVVLLDTVPNKQTERNSEIIRYNKTLTSISEQYQNCIKIDLYDTFQENMDEFYMDETHCNEKGCDCIAQKIFDKIGRLS